ncbi:sulfotransferase [Ruegeria sp. A3M17]|uniref:sulfotransferase family protein n=1 Tax=Ruegeria sp. A3M17 TaxID=2267229 RepID=UPI0013149D68|nr:sulfotransferase [Ruegeria sp. A3M17]
MAKVDFIGIGAQKAATTWLHHVLSGHHSILTSETKELNFFTANYDRGYTWYESCFEASTDSAIRGECSPTYFFSRDAAERAARYSPELKLICILRDPIDRAFSNHMHEIRKGHIPPETTFEDAWKDNPAYSLQSQYKANLRRWLANFDRDALLLLFSEDIASNPNAIYEQVCGHLGVAPEQRPASITERHHENITYTYPAVQKTLRYVGDAMRSLGMQELVKNLKQAPGVKQALSMNKQHLKTMVTPPTQETREMLIDHFQSDIEYVAQITGRAVLPWPTWPELHSDDTAANE